MTRMADACGYALKDQSYETADQGVVHLIDDDQVYCDAIAFLLEHAGLTVYVYDSAEQFLANYEPCHLQCAIVDLRMPGMNGLELQNDLLQRRQQLPLIIVSAYGKTPEIVHAIRSGAVNFLEKPVKEASLLSAVRDAIASDRENKRRSLHRNQALWRLSDRERQVLDLFVAAKTTIEIAHILGISPKTVEKHRISIFDKTNADSVPALIRLVLG
jgi:FixJ family two-component response regulator